MRWHKDKRCETEGILRHPADAEGWKHFDEQHPCFALDTQNVRLTLSSDGFNPFENMSTSYSMWPVILIPYNLPPWKCTILNIDFKTKDTIIAREDLANLKIRKEFHKQEIGNKRVKPHASYTLTVAEKVDFCMFLKSVKFPDGFAFNISHCVNLKEGKIYGLKSHDCHVLLQRLLPIGIRPYLQLDKMQDDIVLILCKLEKIFPPTFFDVMVHLPVHLSWKARIVGPVGYSWMYPIERSLRYLKQYVRNKARSEGSIAKAYVINESLNFCSMYLRGIETRFNRGDRNNDDIDEEEINNCGQSIFSQHIRLHELVKHREHMRILESSNGNGDLYKRQQLEFPTWFKAKAQRLHCDKFISDDLYALACDPSDCARSYSECIANGVRFHTKDRDSHRTTQNSGVMVLGGDETRQIFFYGKLHEIIRLQYICMKAVVLFKCERQAAQVFYVDDYKLGQDWKIVQQIQPRHVWDIPEIESNELKVTSDETISTCYPRVEHNLDSHTFNREDVEPSIIGDQEDIIAQSNEEASTDEALVDEEDFDSNNSSDESMNDEDCDNY
ncbi:uncharacterized protein E5676_scaffold201G00310 [Cucumis melo var. makuwa]|uniref:DUF4218 domain-containing protein n=1 Tax=Cucumis melo var. makuwa TaxID=1194695 RepID=A0A5A7UVN7_CUCMM|nr:uncharacterized protein E6C27_scaffold430G00570 [Cucumis melo var. makuwa]TYK02548.1 uncharacterized protein E5676_scaffold201G00310 [Cucumis melo var. makuwa]